MAVLSSIHRREVWGEVMSDLSNEREGCPVTKDVLLAAVDAIDNWLNTNAITLNQALPVEARTGLTTAQKARLLNAIVRRRYITGA